MSRQVGSLSRSLPYPSNLQRQNSVISISDPTSSPLSVFSPIFSTFRSNPAHLHSDDSTQTIFDARNSLTNPAIDTLDEFSTLNPVPLSTQNQFLSQLLPQLP